ncbi:MAG TPA: hypothetical protein VHU42_03750 [Rhodopila sp.]|nr:hypothetical protein [Rhodopila sp.]
MKWLVLLPAFLTLGSAAMAENLPIPPIPPAHPLIADAAPIPNVDAEAPASHEVEKVSVDVRLYRVKLYDPSLGFAPGSRYQSTEDRKAIQTPGFSVSVPLQ